MENHLEFQDEHRLWGYFRQKIDEHPMIGDELLSDILRHHQQQPLAVMSSVLIALFKEDKISEIQFVRIQHFLAHEQLPRDKAIDREALSFQTRSRIASGQKLTLEDTRQLYEAEAFRTLELAFQQDALSLEALNLFVCPAEGEVNRRHKQSLFQQAQERLHR
ncbi:hypothetical protein B9G55_07115 [Saccharibacillus sp. O16]|nr:hypothetical protein B9G55_07115 [Saccharibacillus sp. O16]